MLVDHPDAQLDGIGRGSNAHRLPIQQDLAFVRMVQAVQHLHQRALAGAVLAQQRMHLAGAHIEVDAFIGKHAGETLGDATHLQVFYACATRWECEAIFGFHGVHRGDLSHGAFGSEDLNACEHINT